MSPKDETLATRASTWMNQNAHNVRRAFMETSAVLDFISYDYTMSSCIIVVVQVWDGIIYVFRKFTVRDGCTQCALRLFDGRAPHRRWLDAAAYSDDINDNDALERTTTEWTSRRQSTDTTRRAAMCSNPASDTVTSALLSASNWPIGQQLLHFVLNVFHFLIKYGFSYLLNSSVNCAGSLKSCRTFPEIHTINNTGSITNNSWIFLFHESHDLLQMRSFHLSPLTQTLTILGITNVR